MFLIVIIPLCTRILVDVGMICRGVVVPSCVIKNCLYVFCLALSDDDDASDGVGHRHD